MTTRGYLKNSLGDFITKPQKNIRSFFDIILDKNTKGVLLDFDNCLYLYNPCHDRAILSVKTRIEKITRHKLDNFFELYKQAQSIIKNRIPNQAASHSRILYFQTLFELIGKGSMVKESLVLEKLYWKKFTEKMKLIAGVKQFLANCKKRSIKIIIISDLTANIQFEKLIKLGVDRFINFIVTSEEAGAEKPDKRIFQLALHKTNLKNNEVIVIGDDFDKDIRGAQALGIKTLQIIHE